MGARRQRKPGGRIVGSEEAKVLAEQMDPNREKPPRSSCKHDEFLAFVDALPHREEPSGCRQARLRIKCRRCDAEAVMVVRHGTEYTGQPMGLKVLYAYLEDAQ